MSVNATKLISDLAPYARMTVADGVTIGNLVFSSAQTIYSTGLIAAGGAGVLSANSQVTLFSGAVGAAGSQGYAAGATLTESETNFFDSDGRLGSNECFVGIRCGFTVYKRSGNALAASETVEHIGSVSALHGLLDSLSWEWNPGDTINRIIGPIGDYPAGGGVYGHNIIANVPVGPGAPLGAQGATNGYPSYATFRKLPLPIVWKPNIRTQVKVSCGSGFTSPAGAAAWEDTDYLAIRMTVQGVKFTMPV